MLTYVRHRMGLDLAEFTPEPHEAGDFQIEAVNSASADDLARLSIECYMDTPDWDLDPDLQTFEGCRDFISKLFSGQEIFGGEQGKFRGDLSFVLRRGKELAGAFYTLFSEDTAFIIDFAVAPSVRGQGVGRDVFDVCPRTLQRGGIQESAAAGYFHERARGAAIQEPWVRSRGYSYSGSG